MRRVTLLDLANVKDPVVRAALQEIMSASSDNVVNDLTTGGNALASVPGATADTVPYFTSPTTAAVTSLTAYARTLIAAASAAAAQVILTLVPGTNVFKQRTITGTSGQITVANGDGISANPTISLDAAIVGAWTAYTPTITANTGTITTKSASGRYTQIGKTVHFHATIFITTNGSGAGFVIATMPVTAQNANACALYGRSDLTGKGLSGVMISTTTIAILNYDGTYPGADGANLRIDGTYEAA
jgi:hypothetical protein